MTRPVEVRAIVSYLVVALVAMGPVSAEARTTSSSRSTPCTPITCSFPAFREDTYVVPGSSLTVPPSCARSIEGVCVAAIQGDRNAPSGTGRGIEISVSSPGPGISVTLILCNHTVDPSVPRRHCPETTRSTIVVVTPDIDPGIDLSSACAVVLGDQFLGAPCATYP